MNAAPASPTTFRPLVAADQARLWHWLHVALWDPPPAGLRPIEVLQQPGVRVYAEDWGREGDVGVVAQVDGADAGACWMRLLPVGVGLGSVDARTPQLGIALEPAFQHQGHGAPLMRAALDQARAAGYAQVSLTVHPLNPARRLYERCGFGAIGQRNGYHLMLATLADGAQVLFESARLRARRLGAQDVDALLAVYGDAQTVRWVGDGVPLTRAQCREWVEVTRRNYAARGYGMFALEERAGGAVLGFCGLVHPGGQPEPEIKYALRRDAWGRGLATEAVAALKACGASRFGLARIIATVAPANEASQRVLLKAGLRRGALRRNDDGSFTQLFEWP